MCQVERPPQGQRRAFRCSRIRLLRGTAGQVAHRRLPVDHGGLAGLDAVCGAHRGTWLTRVCVLDERAPVSGDPGGGFVGHEGLGRLAAVSLVGGPSRSGVSTRPPRPSLRLSDQQADRSRPLRPHPDGRLAYLRPRPTRNNTVTKATKANVPSATAFRSCQANHTTAAQPKDEPDREFPAPAFAAGSSLMRADWWAAERSPRPRIFSAAT